MPHSMKRIDFRAADEGRTGAQKRKRTFAYARIRAPEATAQMPHKINPPIFWHVVCITLYKFTFFREKPLWTFLFSIC